MDIFNALRRKASVDTILAPDVGDSVAAWIERLRGNGWMALYEATPGEESRNGFTIAFCSPWQQKVSIYLFSCFK